MSQEEAALARNDRYLALVEELNFCPFAKRCRETGKLLRRVLPGADPLAAALGAAADVEATPEDAVEVALLIFPGFDRGPRAFEELCVAVRPRLHHFFCVAFHPALAEDVADPHRAVAFIRRSPDPTLQLVRASVLQRVRGSQGSTFVDAKKLTLDELAALQQPRSVSDRIADDNFSTLQRQGVASVRDRLAALAAWKP